MGVLNDLEPEKRKKVKELIRRRKKEEREQIVSFLRKEKRKYGTHTQTLDNVVVQIQDRVHKNAAKRDTL